MFIHSSATYTIKEDGLLSGVDGRFATNEVFTRVCYTSPIIAQLGTELRRYLVTGARVPGTSALADPEGGLRGLQPPLNFQKKEGSPAWPL